MLTATPFTDLSVRMTGRVVTPSDPNWDATRQVINLATDLRPAAVALPRDVNDVIAAVEYAGANGLRVAPQATGHNADALGSLEHVLLVDVRQLQDVSRASGS
jgi:FAD/FMN-containing dehydrogenase